jgi:hypothetical protein
MKFDQIQTIQFANFYTEGKKFRNQWKSLVSMNTHTKYERAASYHAYSVKNISKTQIFATFTQTG